MQTSTTIAIAVLLTAPAAAPGRAAAPVEIPSPADPPAAGAAKDPDELAKDAAAKAERAAEKAEAKLKELENKLDELASGTIIEHGITGGLAVALNTPLPRGTWQQETLEVAAMPYILVLPAYWWSEPETRRFCGVLWTKNREQADDDANAVAHLRAAKTREELVRHIQAGTVNSVAQAKSVLSTTVDEIAFTCAKEVASGLDENNNNKKCTTEELDDLIAIQDVKWTAGLKPSGKCVAHKLIGVWVGLPLHAYKARVSGNEFGTVIDGDTREIKPRVAFGYGLTISAWFSLLIGASYGTLDVTAMDATGEAVTRRGNVWTLTIAPAFNIDIVRALTKAIQ